MTLQNITTRAFKLRFKKFIGEEAFNSLVFKIQDHKVNGVFSEATGHIYNPATNLYVYVNLKPIAPYGYMCRYAAGFKDFSSNRAPQGASLMVMRNRWFKDEQSYYMAISQMLTIMRG